jgi:cbb3-type cytochrome oxidase cytochrome c subunit
MKMTPLVVLFGSTLILFSVIIANVFMPVFLVPAKPSVNAVPYTPLELRGREVYIANGCVYCHTQNVRPMDWGEGSGQASQPGDYAYDSPNLFGQHRTGPDLAREGGYHTDDWHWAHFEDPRYTRPQSLMPSFKFIKGEDRIALIAYIQCLGGRTSQARAAEQRALKATLIKYYQLGPAQNVAYLNSTLPKGWLEMPNPEPVTQGAVERGRAVYVAYCVGCHGGNGDGRGAAKPYLNPPPMDFTLLQASGANPSTAEPGYKYDYKTNRVSVLNNGAIYYAVLNGLPGSAMPAFKGQLESEKSGMSATISGGRLWAGSSSRPRVNIRRLARPTPQPKLSRFGPICRSSNLR